MTEDSDPDVADALAMLARTSAVGGPAAADDSADGSDSVYGSSPAPSLSAALTANATSVIELFEATEAAKRRLMGVDRTAVDPRACKVDLSGSYTVDVDDGPDWLKEVAGVPVVDDSPPDVTTPTVYRCRQCGAYHQAMATFPADGQVNRTTTKRCRPHDGGCGGETTHDVLPGCEFEVTRSTWDCPECGYDTVYFADPRDDMAGDEAPKCPRQHRDGWDGPYSLEGINGVSRAKAQALREAGVYTPEEVAALTPSYLSEIEGIGTALAARIIADASSYEETIVAMHCTDRTGRVRVVDTSLLPCTLTDNSHLPDS